jgi:hypothetical protein
MIEDTLDKILDKVESIKEMIEERTQRNNVKISLNIKNYKNLEWGSAPIPKIGDLLELHDRKDMIIKIISITDSLFNDWNNNLSHQIEINAEKVE